MIRGASWIDNIINKVWPSAFATQDDYIAARCTTRHAAGASCATELLNLAFRTGTNSPELYKELVSPRETAADYDGSSSRFPDQNRSRSNGDLRSTRGMKRNANFHDITRHKCAHFVYSVWRSIYIGGLNSINRVRVLANKYFRSVNVLRNLSFQTLPDACPLAHWMHFSATTVVFK